MEINSSNQNMATLIVGSSLFDTQNIPGHECTNLATRSGSLCHQSEKHRIHRLPDRHASNQSLSAPGRSGKNELRY